GTAQFWRGRVKDNHTWFIAFAPYDNPRYAVAVIVQGAQSGGGVAAPIARTKKNQHLPANFRRPRPKEGEKTFAAAPLTNNQPV
ncbi:MAG: penicillin-binding transpeptidase domain-containing protein, partial [Chthoniobacterales bacterium]